MATGSKLNIKNLVYYPVLLLVCLEISLLILGYRSYRSTPYSIASSPPNAYIGHPELGIQLNPGNYSITINDSLSFDVMHHGPTDRKVTGSSKQDYPEIAMLGCSFTYGFGVNDNEHFTSLLQESLPDAEFHNNGVVGHGTVQSLIELQGLIEHGRLKAAVLNFSSHHLMRNTLSPTYRSYLKIGYGKSSNHIENQMQISRFPYKEHCDSTIKYAAWNDIYKHWMGREWSATINWAQTVNDRWSEDVPNQIDVTACIIQEMAALCKKNNIAFGVACLDQTNSTIELKNKLSQINWVDINFDFNNPKITNHPYDDHPNENGHRTIARKIQPFLIDLLDEE